MNTETQKTLAEIMLGFFWGVLFFSSIVYCIHLFDTAEDQKRSLGKLGFNPRITKLKTEGMITH
jgi:hypothetical protein